MQLPRLSVVMPSFNQGRYLEEALLSLIGQGYPDLEIIVMDGGSEDDSVDIIRQNERHIAYWRSESDEGQAAAINQGFGRASGEILC